ncbi:MAG: GGDEF domain-containing protein [bacterium]
MKIAEYFKGKLNPFLEPIAYILILIIGFIDHLSGPEISISIFYLFPVFLVTWFRSKWKGILICIFAAIAWFIADVTGGHSYSRPVIPYWNATVRMGFFMIVTLLLSASKKALEREEKLARIDFLTGVANSRSFFELANIEINRTRRYRHSFTIAYIDIDNFKAINDDYGHLTGDNLLRLVGGALRRSLRSTDIVARLGGDEFAILLPEIDPEQSQVAISKVRDKLLNVMQSNNWKVTFSVGVITFLKSPESVDEMLKKADNLMYSAKKSGRNIVRYEVFVG